METYEYVYSQDEKQSSAPTEIVSKNVSPLAPLPENTDYSFSTQKENDPEDNDTRPPRELNAKDAMKNKKVYIQPILLCLADLKDKGGRKEAMQQLLEQQRETTDTFSYHHILATKKYHLASVHTGFHLYNFGFQSCEFADMLLDSNTSISYNVYKHPLLKKHWDSLKKHLRENITHKEKTLANIRKGAALIKIWDVSTKSNVFYFLKAFSGHLTNSHLWLFANLDELVRELEYTSEPLSTIDDNIGIWNLQLDYLLCSTRICRNSTGTIRKRRKPCKLFTTYSGQKDIHKEISTLQEEIHYIGRQIKVTDLMEETPILFDKARGGQKMQYHLRNTLSQSSAINVPITWLFLRGALEHREDIFIKKEELRQIATECGIDEDFEEFCTFFTSFGSIFDLSFHKSDIVVVKSDEFLMKLHNAFDRSIGSDEQICLYKQNGIINNETAEMLFGAEGEIFMKVLSHVGLVAEVPAGKYGNGSQTEACYYMPNARKLKQRHTCHQNAISVLLNIQNPPNLLNGEVAFTRYMLSSCSTDTRLQSSTDENVTIINFNSDNASITMIYKGNTIEIVVDASQSQYKSYVIHVIKAFETIANNATKGSSETFTYAFAKKCQNNELNHKYHMLPHDSCDKKNEKIQIWMEALRENPIPQNFKFTTDITPEDIAFIANELKSCDKKILDTFAKDCLKDDNSYESPLNWLNIMTMLTKWVNKQLHPQTSSDSPSNTGTIRSVTKAELAIKFLEWSKGDKEKQKLLETVARRLFNKVIQETNVIRRHSMDKAAKSYQE